eukprot:373077-Alexandrium_andersonii.AAC.1
MVVATTYHDHHHPMGLTSMMVLVRMSTWAQTWCPNLLRGPFCAVVRAEREYGNENLPGAREGSFCVAARDGRGGGIDHVGYRGRKHK